MLVTGNEPAPDSGARTGRVYACHQTLPQCSGQ